MTIRKSDVFRHVLAGAGGFGDPLERDPEAVLRDVRNELISAHNAESDYGVGIDTKTWRGETAGPPKTRHAGRSASGTPAKAERVPDACGPSGRLNAPVCER